MPPKEYRRKRDIKKTTAPLGLDGLLKRYSQVQLATLVDTPPDGLEWLHEVKFDGYRLLGYVSGGASRLQTRNGKDWTNSFPSLSAALINLTVREAVLDMEAVILDADGKSSFQSLQAALGEGGDRTVKPAFITSVRQVFRAAANHHPGHWL